MTKTSPLLPKRYGAGITAVFSQTQAGSTERRLALDRWYAYASRVKKQTTGRLLLVISCFCVLFFVFLFLVLNWLNFTQCTLHRPSLGMLITKMV